MRREEGRLRHNFAGHSARRPSFSAADVYIFPVPAQKLITSVGLTCFRVGRIFSRYNDRRYIIDRLMRRASHLGYLGRDRRVSLLINFNPCRVIRFLEGLYFEGRRVASTFTSRECFRQCQAKRLSPRFDLTLITSLRT